MGGGDNDAAEAANRAEQERQASIKRTQGRVNEVFNSPQREADIADYVSAIKDYYGRELSEQKSDADRELKFALARGGMAGSSVQNDRQELLGKDYAKGLLDVQRRASGAGAELRAADQDARARLISLATSGLDATTAAQQAAAAMRSNLEAGRSTAMANELGTAFGSVKTFADQARDAAQRRKANRDAGWNLYQPSAATAFNYGGGG